MNNDIKENLDSQMDIYLYTKMGIDKILNFIQKIF